MKLAGLDRANDLMRSVLSDNGEGNKVYLSAMVMQSQKNLIEELAKMNRVNQADVLRTIIDEWCEHKLKVNGS